MVVETSHPIRAARCVEISPVTGPLQFLASQKTLVLADVENLRYGARDLGKKVAFRLLARKLQKACGSCVLNAFFSRDAGDDRQEQYFNQQGWQPRPYGITTVTNHQGVRRLANSDNHILFAAGRLTSLRRYDLILLASGDGDLVSDLARFLSSLAASPFVATLSLAGSTAQRLNAGCNSDIYANAEIGLDCLSPIRSRNQLKRKIIVANNSQSGCGNRLLPK